MEDNGVEDDDVVMSILASGISLKLMKADELS